MSEETKIVALSKAMKLLVKEEKVRELSYEQRLALEHAKHFSNTKVDAKTIKKLMHIERVTEVLATKIVEINPKAENEVKAIFAKERFNLEPDEIKEILKIMSEDAK